MRECTRIWAYRPVLVICFLSGQFSSKEKIHESLWTEIWKSTTGPLSWPSSCFPAKKGGSVTDNVVWRAFLKHRAASPALSQTLSAGQRRQPSCPGWAPSGGGWCLSAELCEGPLGSGVNQVHAENPESLSELEVWSVLLDQWEEGINLPRAPPSIILIPVLPFFQKDLCWQKYRPHKDLGGSTAYSYSLPSRRLRSVLGGLTTVGEDHNAFNGKEFKMAANYIFNLFEQNWKDP